MSTYPQYILKSQDVYTFPINTLDTLPLTMPGVIESRDLLRVLVFAAASGLSVQQACEQLARAPSGPTVLETWPASAATSMHSKAMSMSFWPDSFPRGWVNVAAVWRLIWSRCPTMAPLLRPTKTRAGAAQPSVARRTVSLTPRPMPWSGGVVPPWPCAGCGPGKPWTMYSAPGLRAW
jgi:hypothetical protein